MTGLTQLTLKGALDGLKSKAFSSEEITGEFIARTSRDRLRCRARCRFSLFNSVRNSGFTR